MTSMIRRIADAAVRKGRAASCVLACLAGAVPAWAQDVGAADGSDMELRGQLTAVDRASLASEIGARVAVLSVREGDAFKKGGVLVRFDCSVPEAELARARAILGNAEKVFAARQRLVELGSGSELEAELAALEAARARGDVAVWRARVAKCVIVAPFAGKVVARKVRAHQYVQSGTALLEIVDNRALEVEFIVPSSWVSWIAPGIGFEVAIDELGRSFPARVDRLGATVDPVSRSIKVIGRIDGAFPALIAGMSGRILIDRPAAE